METGQSLPLPRKTARRLLIIDHIMDSLLNPSVYRIIGTGCSEQQLKSFIYTQFRNDLVKLYCQIEPGLSQASCEQKARDSLYWEGDKITTVNNLLLFGVQHRPDFMVLMPEARIAIEIKRGDSGQHVRDAIGQSIVYASHFDFTCCVIVDTTRDKRIRASLSSQREQTALIRLWESFNIRIGVT
jgi:hypothetical protein